MDDFEKKTFEELRYTFKDKFKTPTFQNIGDVIQADISFFPLKFGNVVITSIEKLPYSKTPYYKDTSRYWNGLTNEAIVLHGYAVNRNSATRDTYSLNSLDLGVLSKDGNFSNYRITELTSDSGSDKMIGKYPTFKAGDFTKVSINEPFTVLFVDYSNIGLSNIKKIFITDCYDSTNNVLELDFNGVKEGR